MSMQENENVKFLRYLQVCGKEYIEDDDFELVEKKCDFRRYYEFMEKDGEDFEDIVNNYYDLVETIKDNTLIYDKILDISEKINITYKKFISTRRTSEASRRLSCIGDELRISKKDIIKNWDRLNKLYVGPPRVKIGNKSYKMYEKMIKTPDIEDGEIAVMSFKQENLKGQHIGAIIFKDDRELVYKLDSVKDMITISSMIRDLNFEYDLIALAPCFVDIFYELEQYLVGKISKKAFEMEVRDSYRE